MTDHLLSVLKSHYLLILRSSGDSSYDAVNGGQEKRRRILSRVQTCLPPVNDNDKPHILKVLQGVDQGTLLSSSGSGSRSTTC